ncbi:general transcriptional corepressor trfA-like isoform X3 [Metopolophium dirhodum]|uniref:general transcriptional corepressor trfA-like isoform X3 n=1 Tax=Metopolophium dirhodum TaxID=44670 RepID=UPI00298F9B7D|nr:general transcriptional corepressor trfA-like isoform X3 [Metopolophium dirhodum]
MPVETTSQTTEQQVFTVEEDSPKQSEPDLPDIELLDDVPNEPTPSTSTNVLTNGLKRPLPDAVEGDKKKKFRLTEINEDELEVTNKDDSGKNHIELLIQKVSDSLENPISDDESNVSNKTNHNLNNETTSSFNKINHNGNNGIDNKDCKEDYPDRNTLSKDISKDRKKYPSDILLNILNNVKNNFNDSCEFIGNSKDTIKNGKNVLTKNDILTSNGISCLNKLSSSDNLAITENSDHENVAVVNDIQVTENISTAVNDSTVRESNSNLSNIKIYTTENIVNSKKNDAEPLLEFKNKIQHLTKNTDETKSIESPCNSNTNNSKKVDVCSNGIDQDFEVIDSDNSSDYSSYDLTDLPEDISSIISGVKQITKESFPQLLKLFSSKELTYDQFDSMCTQKIIEMMTQRLHLGKDRSELHLLKEREKIWRSKYSSLDRQYKEMKTIVNVHKQELKSNEYARPHLVTRTVGLQAVLCPRKEFSMKLPKQAIPLPKPVPVSIIVEDEDDVVELEFETVESASSSTSKITNTTTKKLMPPLVATSKTLAVSPKNVTASPTNVTASPKKVTASPKKVTASPKTVTATKSLNHINIGITPTTIDLTGNDDVIEESNIINLEDSISPIKIPRRISPSLLPAGTLMSGNSGKTITYLELSKNPSSSSSSFITGTASRSPQRTIVYKDTINTSPKSKNLKPILIEVSRVDPVLVQPCTVTYTGHCVPVSGTLQPMSTASYTPRKITVSQLSASLKTLTPSYTTCQIPASRISASMPGIALPISLHTIHHTGSQSTRKPPPPAIPLLEHPSPVPGIPNQKNLPTWKRLPPAPNLTISKSAVVQNTPQALVLSWTMDVDKTIAEVISYQIFAYQETPDQPPNIDLWKKIGNVNALPLPMACSLTHFSNGQKYHFLVRAVDVYTRVGPFSSPKSMYLKSI